MPNCLRSEVSVHPVDRHLTQTLALTVGLALTKTLPLMNKPNNSDHVFLYVVILMCGNFKSHVAMQGVLASVG